MRTMNQNIVKKAQSFAARWGFLTQDLFYDFICKMSPTQNYRYWHHLIQSGLFVVSKASPHVLILSRKSRQEIFGKEARPSRLPMYIQHDAIAARFILLLSQTGLVENFWLEDDLLRNKILGYQLLGAERINRIPDVIFDLKTPTGVLRCGLEVERTTKTLARYAKMALAYQGHKKIGIVILACGSPYTEGAVAKAFKFNLSEDVRKAPGLFQYSSLQSNGLRTTIRFAQNEFSLAKFLEVVTKQTVELSEPKRNLNEKSISFRNQKNTEAA
ncbi:MAG: hypothetical protein JNM39_07635 [Bdellovibrionaceae bacterium]|nr:hypothetical protein [Pseudobdellovibrionaceae bacterium]